MPLIRRLISTGKVAGKMGVSNKTRENWANNPTDNFPKPVRKNNRMY